MPGLEFLLVALVACKNPGGTDDTSDTGDTADTGDSGDDSDDTDTSDDTSDSDTSDTATYDTDSGGPDDTPPTVISITPSADAQDVALGATIEIVFSEAVAQGTVGASAFVVSGPSGPIGRSVAYGTTSVTVTPSLALVEYHTRYEVALSGNITDLAGNHLVPVESAFTTVATDPRYRYQLFPLDRINTAPAQATVFSIAADTADPCGLDVRGDGDPSQDWRFQAIAATPYVAIGNDAETAPVPNALDGDVAPNDCFAADATAMGDGMRWSLVEDGACTQTGGAITCLGGPTGNKVWRLQNAEHGDTRSLTVAYDAGYIGMDLTADSDEQRFLIRRNCYGGCE